MNKIKIMSLENLKSIRKDPLVNIYDHITEKGSIKIMTVPYSDRVEILEYDTGAILDVYYAKISTIMSRSKREINALNHFAKIIKIKIKKGLD